MNCFVLSISLALYQAILLPDELLPNHLDLCHKQAVEKRLRYPPAPEVCDSNDHWQRSKEPLPAD